MTTAPRTHRIGRWLAALVLLLGLLIGGLVALVSTTAGARMLARLVMRAEPRLSLQVDGGSLWQGLQLSQVTWKDTATDIRLASLDTQWKASFSPEPQINLQRAHAEGLRIDIQPGPANTNTPPKPAAFRFPIHLLAADVQLRDASFHRDTLSIDLKQATLAGEARGKNLDVSTLRLQNLSIDDARPVAPKPDVPSVPWYEQLDPARRKAIVLPELVVPLNLRIQEFALEQASYHRGDSTQQVNSLQLSADWVEQKLTVRQLDVESSYGNLQGKGFVELAGDMPLDLSLQIQTDTLLPSNAITLDATLKNSLTELDFTMNLEGPATLNTRGRIQPLDPRFPVKATLTWSAVTWPLDTTSVVASKSGTLTVEGALDSYSLDIEADVSGPSIPESRWTLHGTGTLHQFMVDPLRGELLNGSLETTGAISWTNGLAWQLDVKSDALDGDFFHASSPTNLTADLQTTGHWQDKDWEAAFQVASLSADWREFPLRLQGQLTGSSSNGWTTPGLTLNLHSNTLLLAGAVTDELDLSGTLQVRQPEELGVDLTGTLDGTWSVKGLMKEPDITLSLEAGPLDVQESLQISKARLTADIRKLALEDSRLELDVESLSRPGQTNLLENLQLIATGSRFRHQLSLQTEGTPAALSLELNGSLDPTSGAWTGALQRATFSIAEIDWELVDHLRMRWNPETRQVTLAPHRWKHNEAELRATEPLLFGTNGTAKLNLVKFDLTEFHPWLPESLRVKGNLGAAADIQWAQGTLEHATASFDIEEGAVQLISPPSDLVEETPPMEIAYDTVHLETELISKRHWTTLLTVTSTDLGSARAEAHIAITTNRTLGDWSGQIELDTVKLQLLQPFIPSLRTLSGDLDASVQLSGNLRSPLLHGTLSLTNGVIEPLEFPVSLGDIHLNAHLQGEQAELVGGFRSGDGLGTLKGHLNIASNAWEASLHLAGDRLALAYDSFAVFQASPDLTLSIQPGHMALAGTILIPQADITIQKLPDTAVRVSPDVRIVDNKAPAEDKEATATPSAWTRSIDLAITLGDAVKLSGFGIKSLLAGQLSIRQTDASAPSANGEIRIETGKFSAFGQKLVIRTGQFLFAGPLNRPTLFVEAVREVPDYAVTVGLRIEGPIDALRTTLFSQPTMPQDEILPYLLLGRPLERGDGGATDGMLTSAAISLGLSQSRGHVTSLAESIGIENFQVGAQGSGDSTEIVVSGQVSPRLQISYGSNVFAEGSTLTLRYRLAKNLFLETVSSLASSLELLYSFAY